MYEVYDSLKHVIETSGIWSGKRNTSHAFLLSPSVYSISVSQKDELARLGFALYDCLLGLSHIAVIAYDQHLNYGGAWLHVRRVFSTGVPSFYQEFHGKFIRDIPQLLKVDFMVDSAGSFKIAEIDGHNKHGLGYSTLGLRFREAMYPNAGALPGAVSTLASEIRRRGMEHIKLFYADQERFYVPEFEIARQEFLKHGIRCALIGEVEADHASLSDGLFLDLPFLYKCPELYGSILNAYRARRVQFVIPPKPFLGAKGVLALLRNDSGNRQLESILHSFIKIESLALVRSYIPQTILIGKLAEGYESARKRATTKRYVLKESISSGMKGTIFSDETHFLNDLEKACNSRMNWILQEEVENQPQTFSWYEDCTKGITLNSSNDWYMRVTAHYVSRKLGDIIVTARRDKAVHGAKDCLQLGTVVT